MTTPTLTYKSSGSGHHVDLDRLVASRLLAQANSGGGKSRLLRQLLEETHGRIQHLVIDPEGEFSTLRERFDYVLAAKTGGDVMASPKTAKLLCRRLVEVGVSAVIDLYELELIERREFVKIFLTELVNLPRSLWRPILVVIDEAHMFAPQSGESQATDAVISLCTLGRKRGLCAVLATQRISKLHKDAAAELLNKAIGRTGLDVDVKRAADELGFDKDARQQLPRLVPGEFFVYGPAISPTVTLVRTGSVTTTHPEPGQVSAAPPPAPSKIKAMLSQLADLPKEAEQEARTITDLEKQVKQLRGDLTRAQRAAGAPDPAEIQRRVTAAVESARTQWTRELKRVIGKDLARLGSTLDNAHNVMVRLDGTVKDARAAFLALDGTLSPSGEIAPVIPQERRPVAASPSRLPTTQRPSSPTATAEGISTPQQRMLDALASFEAIGVEQLAKSHVAVYSDQSSRSSGFRANLSTLSAKGLIERVDSETVRLTDDGRALANGTAAPATLEELHEAWMSKLSGPQRLMLSLLIEERESGIEKDDLAKRSGQSPLSSGYRANLSTLSALGLIKRQSGAIVVSDLLFPEGLR